MFLLDTVNGGGGGISKVYEVGEMYRGLGEFLVLDKYSQHWCTVYRGRGGGVGSIPYNTRCKGF